MALGATLKELSEYREGNYADRFRRERDMMVESFLLLPVI